MHIEGLRKLKAKELKARYRDLFGEESPSSNRTHLFRRIAWRLQANAEGDLSERVRERASELATDADLRQKGSEQAPIRHKKRAFANMQTKGLLAVNQTKPCRTSYLRPRGEDGQN
jgi:Protein of unknown function (DUF2924)